MGRYFNDILTITDTEKRTEHKFKFTDLKRS